MSAASLLTSVPAIPMATPMSARRRAGASLTPSPVIATTAPRPRHASTILQLLLRAHPRVDGDTLDARSEGRRVELVELGTRQDLASRSEDPDPAGDRRRGQRVVAGDHDRGHSRQPAGLDRIPGCVTRRVGHRDQPGEAEVRLGVFELIGDGRDLPVGEREDSISVSGVALGRPCRPRRAAAHRPRQAAARAPRAHPSRRPGRDSPSAWRVVMRRRVASNVSSSTRGRSATRSDCEDPSFAGEGQQRTLRRVARDGPGRVRLLGCAQGRVVAGGGDPRRGDRGQRRWPASRDRCDHRTGPE